MKTRKIAFVHSFLVKRKTVIFWTLHSAKTHTHLIEKITSFFIEKKKKVLDWNYLSADGLTDKKPSVRVRERFAQISKIKQYSTTITANKQQ